MEKTYRGSDKVAPGHPLTSWAFSQQGLPSQDTPAQLARIQWGSYFYQRAKSYQ